MRVVENAGDMKEQMERAVSEAKSSFGDGSVFIEKYVSSPRHIEVQIVADKFGNVVHAFDCHDVSLVANAAFQRRCRGRMS